MSQAGPTWNDFLMGLELGLYWDPIACAVVAGFVLGALGAFVVLRRAVFVTAAVSQAAGLGVALAFLLGMSAHVEIPPLAGALVLSLGVAVVLAAPFERWNLGRDGVIGAVFVGCSALALMVGTRIAAEAHDIQSILFGTAVLVSGDDLAAVLIAGAVVLTLLLCAYGWLVFVGFDRESAIVQGLPVRSLDALLWVMVAVMVGVATRALGALPVFAFIVAPALGCASALKRLSAVVAASAVLGALSGGVGYAVAFFGEFPVGASQSITAILFSAFVFLLGRARGL